MSHINQINQSFFSHELERIHENTKTNLDNYGRYQEEEVFLSCLSGILGSRISCTKKALSSNARTQPNSMISTLEKTKEQAQRCINQAAKMRHPVYAECLGEYTRKVDQSYKDVVK